MQDPFEKKQSFFNTPLRDLTLGKILGAYGWLMLILFGGSLFVQLIFILIGRFFRESGR
jgi:hypothetical protein